MDNAMYYELIVRRANGNGGRYCVAGADADIYRAMDRAWSKGFGGEYRASELDRGITVGEVAAFLRDSLERLIKSGDYNDDIRDSLQACSDSLLHPTFAKIDEAIDKTVKILSPL